MGAPTKVFAYTIDSSALSQTETNFVACIDLSLIDAGTKTAFFTACRSDGMDIVCSGTSGDVSSPYDREVTNFSQGGETGQVFVRVPSVSHLTDTVVYVHTGGGDSVANSAATWTSANFGRVYHHDESSGDLIDSCGNANLTFSGTPTYSSSGKLATSIQYDNVPKVYAYGSSLGGTSAYMSLWYKSTTGAANARHAWWGSSNGRYVGFGYSALGIYVDVDGAADGYQVTRNVYTGPPPIENDGDWHFLAMSYDGTTTPAILVIDGVQQTLDYKSDISVSGVNNFAVCAFNVAYSSSYNAAIDELRAGITAKSAHWAIMEYANINTPNTFATFGAVGDVVGGGRITPLLSPCIIGNSLFRGSLV